MITLFLLILAAIIILPQELVVILTPVVVWLATWAVNKLKASGISGFIIVGVIVPLLSASVAWLTGLLLNSGLSFWLLFGLGLLSVFVNEALKQLKQSVQNNQSKATKELVG